MFEENKTNEPRKEPLIPRGEPVDIFAGTESRSGLRPAGEKSIRPISSTEKIADEMIDIKSGGGMMKKVIIGLVVVIVVGGVTAGFFYLKSQGKLNFGKKDVSTTQDGDETITETTPQTAPVKIMPLTPQEPEIIDTDRDGLSDAEEQTLGTNPNTPDSDNDGLFDFEEVKIYETNPLNPDTDGDGYLDGQEVDSNYNPRGEGKLMDLQREIQKLKEEQGGL